MDTAKELLRAIIANPAEDTPRLAYADWLDENGDPVRAMFIRLQIALERKDYSGIYGLPVGSEAMQNIALAREMTYKKAWGKPLLDLGVLDIKFRRGFPEEVCTSIANFLENGEQLFELAPITRLVASGPPQRAREAREQLRSLAESPLLARLKFLDLGYHEIGDAGARLLAECPHLANLTGLNLNFNNIGSAGAQAIAESHHFASLKSLNLDNNVIGAAGAQVIAGSKHLADLEDLRLENNGIGRQGARSIENSKHLSLSAKLTGLRSAGFGSLAEQVERNSGRTYDGRH